MLQKIIDGNVYYNGVCLKDVADKFKTPLKITFLDIITKRVTDLKNIFNDVIKENSYSGKFIYLNANKANYGKDEILTAFKSSDGLETSSYYDLLLTLKFFKYLNETKKVIYCNGNKKNDYLDSIIDAYNQGYDICDIIDSIEEYNYLKSKNIKLKVGLRVHLKALYNSNPSEPSNDRFGLNEEELNYILEDLKNTSLVLTTIHYHQRGFDYEKDKFELNFFKAFEWYKKASLKYDTLINFDMGGGTPLPLSDDFDYKKWANEIIKTLKLLSNKYNVKEPNLIGENGKYSVKDSTVNIYSVISKKYTDEIPWAFIDGSPIIALPEKYALDEPFDIKPINDLDKEVEKVRIGGLTCDCDDIYFDEKLGYFNIPKVDKVYIGILGTGSYQNSMNGKGGVHHCLLPEETDVICYTKDNKLVYEVRHKLQSIEDICNLIQFK